MSPRTSASTSPCPAPRLVNVAPVGREVTESDWCCHSARAGRCQAAALLPLAWSAVVQEVWPPQLLPQARGAPATAGVSSVLLSIASTRHCQEHALPGRQGSKDQGRTNSCPSSTKHSSQTPLASRGGGEEFAQMRVSRVAQDQRALNGASTSPCWAPRLVAKVAPVGREATESDCCCHSVQAEASGKRARRA